MDSSFNPRIEQEDRYNLHNGEFLPNQDAKKRGGRFLSDYFKNFNKITTQQSAIIANI